LELLVENIQALYQLKWRCTYSSGAAPAKSEVLSGVIAKRKIHKFCTRSLYAVINASENIPGDFYDHVNCPGASSAISKL
jgi:hypothetical protein